MISDKKFAASQELVEQAYNYLRDGYEQALDALEEAETENAKLRELCEDMLDCIEIRAAFGKPPTDEMYERFADAARELGIEVSE